MQGNTKLVVIHQQVVQNGGQTFADGISYVDTKQNNSGTCEITVQSVTTQHFGQWSCTLLSRNGSISKGELHLHNGKFMLGCKRASVENIDDKIA